MRCSVLLLLCCLAMATETWDSKIKTALLANYNSEAFPSNSQIQLKLHLQFLGVVNLSLKDSKVNFKVLILYQWKDDGLVWDPAAYGNKQEIAMKTEGIFPYSLQDKPKIWTPQVQINDLEDPLLPDLDMSDAMVKYDGTVQWLRVGNIMLIKRLSLKDFPFEKHRLEPRVQVNGVTQERLKLILWEDNSPVKTTLQIEVGDNIQWKLLTQGLSPQQQVTVNSAGFQVSCQNYFVEIRRKGMSAVNIMFFPALLVSTLALFSYFIPVNNIVRIQFTTTLLLTLIMLLLMVNRFLPITDEFPYIEQVFLGLITIVFMVDFFVIMIQYYQRQYDAWKQEQRKKKLISQKGIMRSVTRASVLYVGIKKQGTKVAEKVEKKEENKEESDGSADGMSIASIASISETKGSDLNSNSEEAPQETKEVEQVEKKEESKAVPVGCCKRVCALLIKPENLDHLFFLLMSIGFIVFVMYYFLVYYAMWESIQ